MENKEYLSDLKYKIDNYKCAKLDLNIEENFNFFTNESSETTLSKIESITKEFKNKKLKAIWLVIPSNYSQLIHPFTTSGYKFHHIEDNTNLCMFYWLLNTPCNLPNYASRFMGVGGLIINDEGDFLLVKEKNTISSQLANLWKIPTGLAENGESIEQAVVREVKEETGLEITFEGVYAFRETYPYLFNCSDLFFVCFCKCRSGQEINIVDGNELKDCKWFTQKDILDIINEQKFSKFSSGLFTSVFNLLPDKLSSYLLRPADSINVMKSKFTFYSPKL